MVDRLCSCELIKIDSVGIGRRYGRKPVVMVRVPVFTFVAFLFPVRHIGHQRSVKYVVLGGVGKAVYFELAERYVLGGVAGLCEMVDMNP